MSGSTPPPAEGALAGRGALITGANRGLGLVIARAFVRAGADVAICGREKGPLAVAARELQTLASKDQRVEALLADVADGAAVRELVEAAGERLRSLSVLVSNAGVLGPLGHLGDVDVEQWELALRVNLLGPALLAQAMIPHFDRAGGGKIVQIAGGGATAPLEGHSAYAASKAGVVRLAETLAVELAARRVDVNAVSPGALNTRMLDEVLAAGPERVGEGFYRKALAQHTSGGASPERAAELVVWLASPASDGITGKLLSAVWDPWERLDERRADLASDIYTLRRIVPQDRGLDWGEVSAPGSGR
jgi:NAD(P)-dependent dehydrogenase (short-subunit alcohol dehydrogenase family)